MTRWSTHPVVTHATVMVAYHKSTRQYKTHTHAYPDHRIVHRPATSDATHLLLARVPCVSHHAHTRMLRCDMLHVHRLHSFPCPTCRTPIRLASCRPNRAIASIIDALPHTCDICQHNSTRARITHHIKQHHAGLTGGTTRGSTQTGDTHTTAGASHHMDMDMDMDRRST